MVRIASLPDPRLSHALNIQGNIYITVKLANGNLDDVREPTWKKVKKSKDLGGSVPNRADVVTTLSRDGVPSHSQVYRISCYSSKFLRACSDGTGSIADIFPQAKFPKHYTSAGRIGVLCRGIAHGTKRNGFE